MKLTKKDKEQIKTWVQDLRSGQFKQGMGVLYSPASNSFCCLGVACARFSNLDGLVGWTLPSWVIAKKPLPRWLQKVNEDFFQKMDDNLTSINDWGRYNFDEIADLIELVYIHEAL